MKIGPIASHDLKAHLLRAAIEKTAYLFCNTGRLPFKVETLPTIGNHGNHLELTTLTGAKLFIARIQQASEKPRNVQYRPNVEPDLFIDFQNDYTLRKDFFKDPIDVFLATYGDKGMDEFIFGNIGIPGERAGYSKRI